MERPILSSDPLNRPCSTFLSSRSGAQLKVMQEQVTLPALSTSRRFGTKSRQANGSGPTVAHQGLQPAGHEVDKHVELLIRQSA